ncbi:hypothetical protein MLD38_026152 [Melastoma candidum]|uniref:Uncharacterized protein n=1 Tax=Melastoma candidum TaxID=119954 RepID=A0ACB9NXN9_9MYRT|nr:hypothetical protein MLD38_026152 [Melastoma candidum]
MPDGNSGCNASSLTVLQLWPCRTLHWRYHKCLESDNDVQTSHCRGQEIIACHNSTDHETTGRNIPDSDQCNCLDNKQRFPLPMKELPHYPQLGHKPSRRRGLS